MGQQDRLKVTQLYLSNTFQEMSDLRVWLLVTSSLKIPRL